MTPVARKFKKRDSEVPHVPAESKAGDALEYRVARLLIYLGYYVRRGRELYTAGFLNQATDLDVIGIRYGVPFRREIQICECKSGTVGPLDRLFWLAGVKSYINANSAILVRRSTKWNIKDFAGELGVEVLDLPKLEELEQGLAIPVNSWPGCSDQMFFEEERKGWDRVLAANPVLKELHFTLAGEVRFHDPFGGINFLLFHLRSLTRLSEDSHFPSASLLRFLLAECVSQLAMFFMRVAETCASLSDADQRGYIRKGLVYGNLDDKLTERIFKNARRLTGEMVRHYTGKEIAVEEGLFSMPVPPESDKVVDMIMQIAARPLVAGTLVPLTDALLTERFLKQKDGSDWMLPIFQGMQLKGQLALITDYLRFLESIEAVPNSMIRGRTATGGGADKTQSPDASAKVDSSQVKLFESEQIQRGANP